MIQSNEINGYVDRPVKMEKVFGLLEGPGKGDGI